MAGDGLDLRRDVLFHVESCPACARLTEQEKAFQQLLNLAASFQLKTPNSLWPRINTQIGERQPESTWDEFARGIVRLFKSPDLKPAGVALVLALILSGGLTAIRSGMDNPLLVELRSYDLEVSENHFVRVPDTENPFLPEFAGDSNPFFHGGGGL